MSTQDISIEITLEEFTKRYIDAWIAAQRPKWEAAANEFDRKFLEAYNASFTSSQEI